MNNHFQKIQGGVDSLVCPVCLSKITMRSVDLNTLTDANTVRIPCSSCKIGLKISYIAESLYIRCE